MAKSPAHAPAPRVEVEQARLAVLIDADNAQPQVIGALLEEVARHGVSSVRRIYGDFTSNRMASWKAALLKHSIQPVQQFAYTSGKNATDSAMIIDAMDLMHTGRFDGFCLVSSDSDFTRLAQRLREEGLIVYGFGERKTPDPFVQACDKFVYTELLREQAADAEGTKKRPAAGKTAGKAAKKDDGEASATTTQPPAQRAPIKLIQQAIDEADDDAEGGWVHLSSVGQYLNKIRPDFDPRLYGFRKLSELVRSQSRYFAVEERQAGGGGKALYVRLKP
ncbi:MAG: NYN domain-containing protein [Lysobacteraceae bacterium]